MADGSKDLRRWMILAPTPRGAGAVVRHLASVPGFDGGGHVGVAGKGSPHYWPLGVGLRRRRACSPDIRADRWFPPALDQARQEELKERCRNRPAPRASIWPTGIGRHAAVCLGPVQHFEPKQLCELAASLGFALAPRNVCQG